jgi:hypothetical protein
MERRREQRRNKMLNLIGFIRESNRIEGIRRDPTDEEITAHEILLDLEEVSVADLEAFVARVQPGAVLRRGGQNVRVGDYLPPNGGPLVEAALEDLLARASTAGAYKTHIDYELLHPFTDGNGRSGRALWLWLRGGNAPLNFLHAFYYQTLQAAGDGV